MVQAYIQVVSGSKLRQAATHAADFYSVGILYESQSTATFQQYAISAGCLLKTEICMDMGPSSIKNWVPLTLRTCIQDLLIRMLVGRAISSKKLYLGGSKALSESLNLCQFYAHVSYSPV